MEQIIDEFDWKSTRTPNEKCRVSMKEYRGTRKVHIEACANEVLKSKGITFRKEELPNIIAALQKAQAAME